MASFNPSFYSESSGSAGDSPLTSFSNGTAAFRFCQGVAGGSPATPSDSNFAYCSVSQLVEKRLYAWFRCRCIAARAPFGSRAAIAFSTVRCSSIALAHNAGVS